MYAVKMSALKYMHYMRIYGEQSLSYFQCLEIAMLDRISHCTYIVTHISAFICLYTQILHTHHVQALIKGQHSMQSYLKMSNNSDVKADSANNADETTHKILNDTDLAEVRDQTALLMSGNDIAAQVYLYKLIKNKTITCTAHSYMLIRRRSTQYCVSMFLMPNVIYTHNRQQH